MAPACLADCQFTAAGLEHRVKADPSIRWPAENSPLRLQRELGNKFDKNAVKVLSSQTGVHLAYVPGGAVATLAPLLFGPDGTPNEDLRLEAFAAPGTAVRLRVFAAANAEVPTATVRALADFEKRNSFQAAQATRMIAERTAHGQACLADCQFPVAGTRRAERHWPANNTPLQLTRDVSNQIDSSAIMVLEAETFALLGFVPSSASALLAPLLFTASGEQNGALWTYACAASGTTVRLRVFAADDAGVPPEVGALAALAARFPPPGGSASKLRLSPCRSGWVTLTLPADHLEELLAVNTPSSFAGEKEKEKYPLEEEKKVVWLCARRRDEVIPPRSGKWLLYVSPSQQDATWADIVRALAAGLLGPSAKTAPPEGTSSTVFCVYTCDWNDRADVLRVGLALREATGQRGLLSYKTDVHTLAGAYSRNGNSVCCYRLAPGATELSVDEDVVAQARALNDDEPPRLRDWGAGAAGPSRAAHAQPAKRLRTADAVPVEFIDLCDSDDEGAGAGTQGPRCLMRTPST